MFHSVFQRGATTLICDLNANGRRHFEIRIVPDIDPASGVIESYREGATAIRRHAELSWLLRQSGWDRLIDSRPRAAA